MHARLDKVILLYFSKSFTSSEIFDKTQQTCNCYFFLPITTIMTVIKKALKNIFCSQTNGSKSINHIDIPQMCNIDVTF